MQHVAVKLEECSEFILETYVVLITQLVGWFKEWDAGQSVFAHLFLQGWQLHTAALLNSSVDSTGAPDWWSLWCIGEINRCTNKTTPSTRDDVTSYACLQTRFLWWRIKLSRQTFVAFMNKSCIKITIPQLLSLKTHLSSHMLLLGTGRVTCLFTSVIHQRDGTSWIGEAPMKHRWI